MTDDLPNEPHGTPRRAFEWSSAEAGAASSAPTPHPASRIPQPDRLRLYLVTDARAGSVERLVRVAAAALEGGVTAVQLRAKGWDDRSLYDAAVALRVCCREAGVPFIVNDRVDLALAVGADGVHLGVADLPVAVARRLLGPDALIGYSPETARDRLAAERAGADYLGVGPVFGTATKHDAGTAIGLEGLAVTVAATRLPVIGIGGIDLARVRDVIAAGAVGVAVVSAICFADDPSAAARAFARQVGAR